MATSITITYDDKAVSVHVTDSTGRDQTATVPRYGTPDAQDNAGTEAYVQFVNKLDVFMYGWESSRVCNHVHPRCGGSHCGLATV